MEQQLQSQSSGQLNTWGAALGSDQQSQSSGQLNTWGQSRTDDAITPEEAIEGNQPADATEDLHEEDPHGEQNLFQKFVEVGITAPARGAVKGIGEVYEFAGDLIPDAIVPEMLGNLDQKIEGSFDKVVDYIPEPQTLTGGIISDVSQFGVGWVAGGAAMKTVKAANWLGKGIKHSLVRGAIADASAFDPFEENVSSIMKENEWSIPIITEALANDEDGTKFMNRLRNAGEGVIFAGAMEGAAKLYRLARGTKKAKEEFIKTGEVSVEARKEVDEAADDLNTFNEEVVGLGKDTPDFIARSFPERIKQADRPVDETTDDLTKTTVVSEEDKVVNEAAKQKKIESNKRYDISRVKANTEIEVQEKKELASKVAKQNVEMNNKLILDFEERLRDDGTLKEGIGITKMVDGKKVYGISKMVFGRLVIDPEAARKVSKEKLRILSKGGQQQAADLLFGSKKVDINEAINLSMSEGEMFSAMLKPEKFDAIVAIASDFKKLNPKLWDDSKTTIENLFNATIGKQMEVPEFKNRKDKLEFENSQKQGAKQTLDLLAKYNLSFEDYMLTVVGSGSEAGRILNQLSQIKRVRPLTQQEALKQKKMLEQQGKIRDTVMRIENIRRGLMVSQVATASRNLISGLIRAPLEVIGKMTDEVLWNYGKGGFAQGLGTLGNGAAWKGSFKHLELMFAKRGSAQAYTKFIMEQPELADNLDRFYNQMADMQIKMGRGNAETTAGKVLDSVVSRAEDATSILNIPNRFQEFMLRNGMFLADMERLTKREWGIDLIDAINDGKIRDIIGDASSVRPTDGRSFIDMADEAMKNALDVTYAAEPDLKVFRQLNTFIVQNGLTTVLPFPRFMFKSMELLAQYAVGSSVPLTRLAMKAMKGERGEALRTFTAKERDMIGKNIQGLAVYGAAIAYRAREDAPADYKQLNADDGQVIDATALFPLRPALLVGELTKQGNQGTLEEWSANNPKEIIEVLTGTNFRTGMTNFLLTDIVNTVFGGEEVNSTNLRKKGAILGNYFSTFLVPYAQVIDAARVGGLANNQYTDVANEPSLDENVEFLDEFARPFRQRYKFTGEDAPVRQFALKENMERSRLWAKMVFGLNFHHADPEYAAYLKDKGYTEFKLGFYSRSPEQRRFMNKHIREYLKVAVPALQEAEDKSRRIYERQDPENQELRTFEEFFKANVLSKFDKKLRKVKGKLKERSLSELELETLAYLEFNKFPKQLKRNIITNYELKYGEADTTDPQVVIELIRLGKAMRKN